MLNNYFTLKEISKFLNETISGYAINEIYSQEKNKLFIKVFNEEKNDIKTLEYNIEKSFNYILVKNNFSKKKTNYANIFKEVYGKKILNVNLYNDDRVINFKLENGLDTIFTFFSTKANCFVIENYKVINSFKDREKYFNNEIEKVIPQKNKADTEKSVGISINRYAKRNFRMYGDLYIKEALFRAKLGEDESADEEKIKTIKNEFNKIDEELNYPKYFLYSDGKEIYTSILKLNFLSQHEQKELENINELISEYVKLKSGKRRIEELKLSRIEEISQKIKSAAKKIDGLKTQLLFSERSDEFRKIGEIILQNLKVIKKGDKSFTSDFEGSKISFKLKEELSPVENAQYYFDKYKRQKSSVEILNLKKQKLEIAKAELEIVLGKISEMDNYKQLVKEEKSGEKKNDETARFRKFKLSEQYEVWVGKNSASNDLLTTKYATQNDLWFHVRGASGSHTVLKINNKKNIDKEIINRAAAIAAYYSKARNASSVPVAYCEKKYVKKKKRLKEGSVIMEREKVIFVKPTLPDSI